MNAIHLCCGAGGITLGFERAGIKTALAFDIQEVAVETHKANFPQAPAEVLDIRFVQASDLPAVDVWTCGIPCSEYSLAGLRTMDDAVSWELARLLNGSVEAGNAPSYLFLENVREYKNSNAAQAVRDAVDRAGLLQKEAIFKHANYGVAQVRKRWHLLAGADSVPCPEPTHAEYPNLFGLIPWVTFGEIRQKLEDIEDPKFMSAVALTGIIRRQRRKTQVGVDKNCGVHACLYVVKDDDMMYTMMASSYKGLSRNQAVVVAEEATFNGVKWVGFREPTELEWRRSQGLPDDFIVCGNKRQRYEQVGRAVAPSMAEAVAKAMVEDDRKNR